MGVKDDLEKVNRQDPPFKVCQLTFLPQLSITVAPSPRDLQSLKIWTFKKIMLNIFFLGNICGYDEKVR